MITTASAPVHNFVMGLKPFPPDLEAQWHYLEGKKSCIYLSVHGTILSPRHIDSLVQLIGGDIFAIILGVSNFCKYY